MPDPLSAASGVVALVTAGLQATSSLLQVIRDFQRAPSTIRQLKEELQSLTEVLKSLQATFDAAPDDFALLGTPLKQCTKACQEFELILLRCAGPEKSARQSFQGWARLKYHGSDINGFKEAIASYKQTISVSLANVNL
jgi:Fungal N-terminal domain of STAND proteins